MAANFRRACAPDVLTAADLPLLRDGVILANAGHFPVASTRPSLTATWTASTRRRRVDHPALRHVAAENDATLATLREQVDKFDATADPGTPAPLNRLVAEFGLRSYQTLREWAQWALDNLGETDTVASEGPEQ